MSPADYRSKIRILTDTGIIYAGITHADLNEHTVAIPAGYPANTRALYIRAIRTFGTGFFYARSGTGNTDQRIVTNDAGLWIRAVDGLFYYALTVINDVWDIYILGYFSG